MSENTTTKTETKMFEDDAINPVPLDKRAHWMTPAMIFAGLQFCIPVIMIGSILIASFTFIEVVLMTVGCTVLITLPFHALNGYMGAKSGLTSSVAAKSGFGEKQARFVVALIITLIGIGHWANQTAITGNAMCAAVGIDYLNNWGNWALVTVICGALFCIPAVLGFNSMKWTDYIAVPAGMLVCIVGVYMALRQVGFLGVTAYVPANPTMTRLEAINLLISINGAMLVLTMDYSRYAKPKIKDNILLSMGTILVAIVLIIIGALMGLTNNSYDIVQIMIGMGFPFWGYLVLWLSTWTSQLVNNYSAGLSLANIFNLHSWKGRTIATLIGTAMGIVMALFGIFEHMADLYLVTGLALPAIAGVLFVDFFLKKQNIYVTESWNWVATIALVVGIAVGWISNYTIPFGIPTLQSLGLSALIYYVGMRYRMSKEETPLAGSTAQ